MSYFIYEGIISPSESFIIDGEEVRHISQARRTKVGHELEIQDDLDKRYLCEVTEIKPRSIEFLPIQEIATPAEPEFKIYLYQSIVKEKALDFIIQKTTELGVYEIHLYNSAYSQQGVRKDKVEAKMARWNKIALEACKQSGRVKPPTIRYSESYPEIPTIVVNKNNELETVTYCLHQDGEPLTTDLRLMPPKKVNLIIGPEGGFSEEELESLVCSKIKMGPRILRADTAAISAVAGMQFILGDMSY